MVEIESSFFKLSISIMYYYCIRCKLKLTSHSVNLKVNRVRLAVRGHKSQIRFQGQFKWSTNFTIEGTTSSCQLPKEKKKDSEPRKMLTI